MTDKPRGILGVFGLEKMPWIIRVYLFLFLVLVLLLLVAGLNARFLGLEFSVMPETGGKIFTVASESLKVVLGALLGSLSMAATRQWAPPGRTESDQTPPEANKKA